MTLQVSGTLNGAPSVSNYNNIKNKPQINGVELVGNKTAEELGLITEEKLTKELEKIKIPTKVSELENDNQYQTKEEVSQTVQAMEESISKTIGELQKTIDDLVDGNEVAY